MKGVTLVELIVALALVGLILGISGLALGSLRPPSASGVIPRLDAGRAEALRTGRPVVVHVDTIAVRFAPDGSSSGGTIMTGGLSLTVDPMTGAVHAAP
jgi:prepilin-type N-terminal cleavage/methylation domain-containing protein